MCLMVVPRKVICTLTGKIGAQVSTQAIGRAGQEPVATDLDFVSDQKTCYVCNG